MATEGQRRLMGAYIRQQRKLADLSMRQVSTMVGISNPYLSQIERGLRAPSEAVAAGIATALGVDLADLYADASPGRSEESDGLVGETGDDRGTTSGVLAAIGAASELTSAQRASLAEIYRSFVRANDPSED